MYYAVVIFCTKPWKEYLSSELLFQVKDMEEKLTKLRQGVTLVNPEERKAVEGIYLETVNQWRRRKRMFKDVWDAITENSPKDLKEFKVFIKLIAM